MEGSAHIRTTSSIAYITMYQSHQTHKGEGEELTGWEFLTTDRVLRKELALVSISRDFTPGVLSADITALGCLRVIMEHPSTYKTLDPDSSPTPVF